MTRQLAYYGIPPRSGPWENSIIKEDLIVKCPDGSVKYTWEINEELHGVVLDYKSIKACEEVEK
jgi:hypothetical protein